MSSPYLLTTNAAPRLILALALSLLAHASLILPDLVFARKKPSTATVLQATLRRPPPAPPEQPPLALPEQLPKEFTPPAPPTRTPTPKPAPKPPPRPPQAAPKAQAKTWLQAVARHLKKLDEQGLFYPAGAIARGEQGEVLVLLIIDESGRVAAARVEQSSGYPDLDAAALRAVRTLHSLPADAPRQTLLPVRFRLN